MLSQSKINNTLNEYDSDSSKDQESSKEEQNSEISEEDESESSSEEQSFSDDDIEMDKDELNVLTANRTITPREKNNEIKPLELASLKGDTPLDIPDIGIIIPPININTTKPKIKEPKTKLGKKIALSKASILPPEEKLNQLVKQAEKRLQFNIKKYGCIYFSIDKLSDQTLSFKS